MTAARSVRHLYARAHIADPAPEVRRARSQAIRGDPGWRRRLQRYAQGDTTILELTATALIDTERASADSLCFCHERLWVDGPIDRGTLAERLCGLARGEFRPVAAKLRERGVKIASPEGAITVALVSDPTVAAALRLGSPAPPSTARWYSLVEYQLMSVGLGFRNRGNGA